MKRGWYAVLFAAMGLASGCKTMVLAPGAEQVKVTRNSADVAGCRTVGNVSIDPNSNQLDWDAQVRNKTLGLGGNVLFVTSVPDAREGVAYRCN